MLKPDKKLVYLFVFVGILILGACSMPAGPTTGSEVPPTAAVPATETPAISSPVPETPSASPEMQDGAAQLDNTQWSLVSYGEPGAETPVIEGSNVTLEFVEEGQAGGQGGCNSYGTQVQVEENMLSFGPVTSTLMACAQDDITEQEQEFFAALETAADFELAEDRLTIWYNDGQSVLNFVTSGAGPVETQGADLLCSTAVDAPEPNWEVCRSELYGFEVHYPQEADLREQTKTTARIDLPFEPDTNLTEKYLDISVVENAETCSSPQAEGHDPGTIPEETVEVNGLEFLRQTGQGAAAGNRYDWIAYSIQQENRCVSLDFILHSFVPELQPTPPPVYDMEAESEIFAEIAATFQWLQGGGVSTATPASTTPGAGQPTPTPERINFGSGSTSAAVSGNLPASGSDLYVIRALQGQTMTVDLSFSEGEAILAVWGDDGTVLISDHAEATRFTGILPSTQDYFILLKGRPDGATRYNMQVSIPPLPPGQPTPAPERIRFGTGDTTAAVTGRLPASGSDLYVIRALEDQTMTVELSFTSGAAILAVWGADGTVLMSDHAEASRFSGVLPSTQDYYILLKGRPDGATQYSMEVSIPPIAPGQPTPTPERISFDTGSSSATLSGNLPASGSALYVIRALEDQTMTVDLSFSEGRAILAVWGADGTVLMSDHAEASRFSGVLPSTQDYFILLKGRPDGATQYSMVVSIPPR